MGIIGGVFRFDTGTSIVVRLAKGLISWFLEHTTWGPAAIVCAQNVGNESTIAEEYPARKNGVPNVMPRCFEKGQNITSYGKRLMPNLPALTANLMQKGDLTNEQPTEAERWNLVQSSIEPNADKC